MTEALRLSDLSIIAPCLIMPSVFLVSFTSDLSSKVAFIPGLCSYGVPTLL